MKGTRLTFSRCTLPQLARYSRGSPSQTDLPELAKAELSLGERLPLPDLANAQSEVLQDKSMHRHTLSSSNGLLAGWVLLVT